ncbi:MAG: tetratricopeptide repeat protein [bacterium]
MSKLTAKLDWLVAGLALGYLSLFWLAAGSERWWGINHLKYLSSDLSVSLLLAAVVLPLGALTLTAGRRKRRVLTGFLAYGLVPLALVGLFYLLRMSTHYLGDGILRARELELGVWQLPTEPLAVFVNYLAYQVTAKLARFHAIEALESVSVISGALFYFAGMALVKHLFQETRERIFGMLLLFGSGISLLFCGYVETYSLLPAVITFYLLVCLRAADGKSGQYWPALLFPLLALFHFGNLYLTPVLLLVAHYQWRDEKKPAAIAGLIAVGLAVALTLIVPRLSELSTLGLTGFLIALTPGADSYWLFSEQHMIDILSELLLTAGPALILLPLTLWLLFSKSLWRQRKVALMLAALPGAAAFMLLLDSKLGYASDWDLFSSVGLVLTISTLVILSAAKIRVPLIAKTIVAAGGVFAFLTFATVNTDFDRSIERQADILTLYGSRGAIGFETMGNHLNQIGDTGRAERMWRESLKLLPHRRLYGNLGQLLVTMDRIPEARFYLQKGIELDSTYAPTFMVMGNTYCLEDDYKTGEIYLRRAAELDTNVAAYPYSVAICLSSQGRLGEAEGFARRAVELKSEDPAYNSALGLILAKEGKYQEAEQFFLVAQRGRPADSNIYLNLAELYAHMGAMAKAQEILQRYLQMNPGGSASAEVLQYLQKLQGIGQPQP